MHRIQACTENTTQASTGRASKDICIQYSAHKVLAAWSTPNAKAYQVNDVHVSLPASVAQHQRLSGTAEPGELAAPRQHCQQQENDD